MNESRGNNSSKWLLIPFRVLGWRFWITFVIACAISEGGELIVERIERSGGERSAIADSLITVSGLYQRIVTAPRNPVVHFTSVVEIDPERDLPGVSASNVCAEREFMARLLSRIPVSTSARRRQLVQRNKTSG
jgi:hypothetical protein